MVLAGLLGEVGSWTQVIVGVGLLIFIHEMGHFLVAKWAGVRVLAFSLGFGPEIAGFTRGPTRYRLSLVPLGGYVKMSGETELPTGGYAPDDYPAQPVGKRALIIVAGVAMNAVLGFLLFAAALTVGLRTDPVTVGTVSQGGAAWEAGVRVGDRILAAGRSRVILFPDLMYATMAGRPLDLELERAGRRFTVPVTPRAAPGSRMPAIGVSPASGNRVEVPPGGTAEKAGFLAGDEIVSLEGFPFSFSDLSDGVYSMAVLPECGPLHVGVRRGGLETVLSLPRPPSKSRTGIVPLLTTVEAVRPGGPAGRAGWKPGDRPLAVGGRAVRGSVSFLRAVLRGSDAGDVGLRARVARAGGEVDLPVPGSAAERLELLRDLRFASPVAPTAVEVLPDGPEGPDGKPAPSPAEAAGIPTGARITEVAGAAVKEFKEVSERIAEQKGARFEIAWETDAGKGRASVTPAPYPSAGFPDLDLETALPDVVVRAGSPGEVVGLAWDRCVLTTRQIVTTVTGIFRGSVDSNNLGGPILIAQVAHRSSKSGAGHFLWILATLSINLMFLNVLPIPLLDGGQLALLGLEAVTRKAPSEATVGIAQMVGLAFLLALMVFATFNDVARLLGP